MRPYINEKKCYVNPQICTAIKGCDQNAISYIEDDEEPLGGKIIFDYEKCNECGNCAKVCCGDAIDIM